MLGQPTRPLTIKRVFMVDIPPGGSTPKVPVGFFFDEKWHGEILKKSELIDVQHGQKLGLQQSDAPFLMVEDPIFHPGVCSNSNSARPLSRSNSQRFSRNVQRATPAGKSQRNCGFLQGQLGTTWDHRLGEFLFFHSDAY